VARARCGLRSLLRCKLEYRPESIRAV
jgi:hypothetical protein